jgi:hypothetical protein
LKKVLKHEADTGIVQTAHWDGDGGLVIETKQDISSIIEQNKREYNATDERARWGEWSKIGSIPLAVIQDLNRQGILRGFAVVDMKRFKDWLNHPDNRFFRTRPGKV